MPQFSAKAQKFCWDWFIFLYIGEVVYFLGWKTSKNEYDAILYYFLNFHISKLKGWLNSHGQRAMLFTFSQISLYELTIEITKHFRSMKYCSVWPWQCNFTGKNYLYPRKNICTPEKKSNLSEKKKTLNKLYNLSWYCRINHREN